MFSSFVRMWRCMDLITKALSKDAKFLVMTAPTCYCAKPAALRTVKKDTQNKGRAFFGCPREPWDKARCDFFQWLEASEPTTAQPPVVGRAPARLHTAPSGTHTTVPCSHTKQARLDRIERQLTAAR